MRVRNKTDNSICSTKFLIVILPRQARDKHIRNAAKKGEGGVSNSHLSDMWMYPALALWRPDFMPKMLQYRVDRLPGAYANSKIYGM